MALNFPSTPTLNEIYTDGQGRSWKWNGTAWEAQAVPDPRLPAITKLTVTANDTTSFRFDQYGTTDNPTVYALSGTTIAFDLAALEGHPFFVQDSVAVNYDTGLVHIDTDNTETTGAQAQGKTSGVLYWKIPIDTTGDYVYVCGNHPGTMTGTITVKDTASL